MKNVAITGPQTCEVQSVPEPRAFRDIVKIRILSAPMCTEFTDGDGADAGIETSSAPGAAAFLVAATRRRGRVASTGWGGPMDAAGLVAGGLEVHGIWHWNHLRDSERMLRTIRRARPLLDIMVTHRFPIDRVREAWELQLTAQCGKVILHPWDEQDEGDAVHIP